MKTKDFLNEHNACSEGAEWGLAVGEDMSDVWSAMIEQKKFAWLLWTASRLFVGGGRILRKLACRFIRETPLADGRTVWDLLTDERSRNAVEVAEFYAYGKATKEELESAYAAAYAVYAATDTDDFAACAAACAAAWAARAVTAAWAVRTAAAGAAAAGGDEVADAAASAAQVRMIAELGNPFKKGQEDEYRK